MSSVVHRNRLPGLRVMPHSPFLCPVISCNLCAICHQKEQNHDARDNIVPSNKDSSSPLSYKMSVWLYRILFVESERSPLAFHSIQCNDLVSSTCCSYSFTTHLSLHEYIKACGDSESPKQGEPFTNQIFPFFCN